MTRRMSLGSDPEFVIKRLDGTLISAPHALKESHDVMEPTKIKTRFGEVFADNANLELSINYADTKTGFTRNVKGALGIAHKVLGKDFTLHAIPSLDYPATELTHPICKKFGCQPDYDAFRVEENVIPEGATERSFRTCGGHVHIGNVEGIEKLQDFNGRIHTVKLFELILGTPGVLLDNTPASIKRRSLYGGAGAHRPKEYGVECRSLSNFWTQTPELVGFIWDGSEVITRELMEGNMKNMNLDRLPSIINKANNKRAQALFNKVCDQYPEMRKAYETVQEQKNLDSNVPLSERWQL